MRRYLLVSVVAVAGVLLGSRSKAGEHTVVLQQGQEVYGQAYTGTADSNVYSGAPDANYGRYYTLTTGGTNVKRLFIKFKVFASEGVHLPEILS